MKERKYDAILLLGLRLKDGSEPEDELILRVKKAAEVFKSGASDKIIACGGRFSENEKTEAEVMEALLLTEGIDKSRIIREDKSRITYENIENAKSLLNGEKGCVCVVTSDYHARRAKLLCRMMGLKAVCEAAVTPNGREKRAKKRLEWIFLIDTLIGNQRPGKRRGRLTSAIGRAASASSLKALGREMPDGLKKDE